MNFIKQLITFLVFFFAEISLSSYAHSAPTYVHINDMSLLQYQLTADGNVYFRNLKSFNSTVTGCCYAFVLNTTTPYGKSAWAIILLKMATKQPLSLYVTESNPPTSGTPAVVDHMGNW